MNQVPAGVVKFVTAINNLIINPLLALLFTAALFIFFLGLFNFIRNTDSEQGRADGKRHMLWGIIGMAAMVGVFTILQVGLRTFDIGPNSGTTPQNLPLWKTN